MSSENLEDAMAEVIPMNSPARHLPNDREMTPVHEAHLSHVVRAQSRLIDAKYRAGQRDHGGTLFKKPGMLANAIDEQVDLAVYLITLHEQIEVIAADLRMGNLMPLGAADALDRLLRC